MKRYILTGTPGSGKTSILHELKRQGYSVVEEAATDVNVRELGLGHSEPWLQPDFIDSIVHLQKQRQLEASTSPDELQWYDRSPICTLALSRYLGHAASPSLLEEIERIELEGIYQRRVFFIEHLGFCQPTEVRKITFEESLVFEIIHEETYASLGVKANVLLTHFGNLKWTHPHGGERESVFLRSERATPLICSAMAAQSVPSEEPGIKVAALLSALLTPGSSDGWKNAPIAFSKKTMSCFFAQEE